MIAVAIAGAFAIQGELSGQVSPVFQPPGHPAQLHTRAEGASITQLRSRFISRSRLEVWGSTDAPDGSSITLREIGSGLTVTGHVVPAVSATVTVPPAMRNRSLRVTAAVLP